MVNITCFSRLSGSFWEASSTKDNLALEASDRPETRLELLARLSSARFFFHFLISSRIKQGTQLITNPSNDDYWVRFLTSLLRASFSNSPKLSLTFTSTPGAQGYPRGSLIFTLTPWVPAHSENAPRRLRAEERFPRFLGDPGVTN